MPSLVLARRNVLPESVTRPWRFALVRREDQGPVSGSNVTQLAIILGVAIPIVVAVIVLFLHRRNVRRIRMEDAKESDLNLDFGMGDAPVKGNRREKATDRDIVHKPCQLSMDMKLSSPYLLPPGAHQSHDSIHTLARSFRNEQDPYRPVTRYGLGNNETDSLTSSNPFHDPSTRSSSKRTSLSTAATTPPKPALLTSVESKLSASSDEKVNPFTTPTLPEPSRPLPAVTSAVTQHQKPQRPVQPIYPEINVVSNHHSSIDASLFPVPASSSLARPHSPPPTGPVASAGEPVKDASSDTRDIGVARSDGHDLHFFSTQDPPSTGLGLDLQLPPISSPPLEEGFFTDTRIAEPLPGQAQTCDDAADHGHGHDQTLHHLGMSEAPALDDAAERGRGAAGQRPSREVAPSMQHGLDVPQQQAKRLSVSYRPLPPEEVTESEDPEYHANRIRSFYREYFDDSREAAPPMPGQQRRGGSGYAGYDMDYLGDAAYYDAYTNAFVMPYAQPVTRRAMTPPSAGRFRGAPGSLGGPPGPRSPHGSIGGMSLPGGPGGHHHRRPRAGSAYGPRPGSSASAMMRGPPRKRLPPSADLKTLPTPSKLKDDSFALMNAIDFAPPDSFREYAAGRSQSPLGERRPYQPKVPVSSPLVTAFDELAALPSPHHRKSATFTNLDFAPPKKFKDADSMSDAGSVRSGRSNRSGVSAMQLGALRNGAGRISRLPNDTVFTAAATSTQLKPQWGMRS